MGVWRGRCKRCGTNMLAKFVAFDNNWICLYCKTLLTDIKYEQLSPKEPLP